MPTRLRARSAVDAVQGPDEFARRFRAAGRYVELGDAAPEMHRKIGLLLATIGAAAVFFRGFACNRRGRTGRRTGRGTDSVLQDDEEAVAFLKRKLRKGD